VLWNITVSISLYTHTHTHTRTHTPTQSILIFQNILILQIWSIIMTHCSVYLNKNTVQCVCFGEAVYWSSVSQKSLSRPEHTHTHVYAWTPLGLCERHHSSYSTIHTI